MEVQSGITGVIASSQQELQSLCQFFDRIKDQYQEVVKHIGAAAASMEALMARILVWSAMATILPMDRWMAAMAPSSWVKAEASPPPSRSWGRAQALWVPRRGASSASTPPPRGPR